MSLSWLKNILTTLPLIEGKENQVKQILINLNQNFCERVAYPSDGPLFDIRRIWTIKISWSLVNVSFQKISNQVFERINTSYTCVLTLSLFYLPDVYTYCDVGVFIPKRIPWSVLIKTDDEILYRYLLVKYSMNNNFLEILWLNSLFCYWRLFKN